ncbi:protein of unknown function [Thermomonospora echinospora]|uniref:DUF4829 domain-containing protein n=1 Tax=Thermomonospora echinospora TaxID=1992 RepID=A0A1H6DXA1_9ACTN|nr:protein of unknown function [Thermomonospora echinospora]
MEPGLGGVRIPLLVLLAGVALVTGCGSEGPKSRVGIPPVGASPQEVVTAYVAAINAHDKEAGRRLSTPHFAQQQEGGEDDQFRNIVEISHLQVQTPLSNGGHESADGKRYQDAVYVPVTFILKQREVVSMPNGHTAWGYILVRTGADQPWRINDHGVG